MRLTFTLIALAVVCGCAYQPAQDRAPYERPAYPDRERVSGPRGELLLRALGLVGVPYRYGGRSPETGFDCSGLVHYVFSEVVGLALPRRAQDMSRVGEAVERYELTPGDLVFFDTLREPYSHVGIYLGGQRFIHAPSSGGQVEVVSLSSQYWRRRYNGARRIDY